MNDRNMPPAVKGSASSKPKPWVAPKIVRIDAGQAEIGTRAASDGPFSTS